MRNVRRTVVDFGWRHDEDERRCRECRKSKRRNGARDENLRRHGAAGVFLMVDDRAAMPRRRRMTGEVRVQRLSVMVRRLALVEVHVRQRRGRRPELHEHTKSRCCDPPHHGRIVTA